MWGARWSWSRSQRSGLGRYLHSDHRRGQDIRMKNGPAVFLLLNLALAFYNVGTIWAHEIEFFSILEAGEPGKLSRRSDRSLAQASVLDLRPGPGRTRRRHRAHLGSSRAMSGVGH